MSDHKLKAMIFQSAKDVSNDVYNLFAANGIDAEFAAKDGFQALENAKGDAPDAVVLDLFSSKMDVAIGVKSLKKIEKFKSVKFIMVSSFFDKIIEKEIVNCGVDCFILKPFDCATLIGIIKRVCGTDNVVANQTGKDKNDVLNNISQNRGNEPGLELEVTKILHQIGIPAHIKGYNYLRCSIMLSVNTPSIINAVTKMLYPSVAINFSTTASRVERSIRHAIEVTWSRGNVEILDAYFKYTAGSIRRRPTNSEFIAMISDRIRLQMESAS
ncbi:MAG: sporulation transcription factor Spo0A [Oscillospiraceae bacterium]|jgi:two-component system response regulator (stage 0 sporulation protein A)|nr:sporulation transcription factor Spo0A [Oscillospiraceae bacterium]